MAKRYSKEDAGKIRAIIKANLSIDTLLVCNCQVEICWWLIGLLEPLILLEGQAGCYDLHHNVYNEISSGSGNQPLKKPSINAPIKPSFLVCCQTASGR